MDMSSSDDLTKGSPIEGRVSAGRARDVPAIVGSNLKALRKSHDFSLERLAELSGVSRAMLGQIETGKSVPTVGLLWKIADALGVPVAYLIATPGSTKGTVVRKDASAAIVGSGGRFVRRPLFPLDGLKAAEFYELRLSAGHSEDWQACPAGTQKNLAVSRGRLVVGVGLDAPAILEEGDAIQFPADVGVSLENAGSEDAVAFLVVTRLGRAAP
jgi:transcriptional regulator with XRE-family HTH domain